MRKGHAEINIEYKQGEITVTHSDDGTILAQWTEPEYENHWDRLWEFINHHVHVYAGYKDKDLKFLKEENHEKI